MNSEAVIVWLVLAVVLGIAEGATTALVSIWMAAAAVIAAVTASFGQNLMVQILTFLLVSAVLLILTAPLSRRFRTRKSAPTNADRLLGQEGVVLVPIDPIEKKGQVKVLGQVWSASGADGETIAVGERVIVEAIEGVHAIVRKKIKSV